MGNMKECFKPHVILHSAAGLGIGLVLASLIPTLSGKIGLWLGLIIFVLTIIIDPMVNK